jgi:hypothetical protein
MYQSRLAQPCHRRLAELNREVGGIIRAGETRSSEQRRMTPDFGLAGLSGVDSHDG